MRLRIPCCLLLSLLVASRASAQIQVEGVVHLADGKPLADATVRIEAPDYKRPLVTTTDADGHYAFPDVKPGIRVRVVALQENRAVAEAFALVTLWVETINLDEQLTPLNTGSAEYLVASDGPSGAVAGRVLTADGRALSGARITVGDSTLTTSTDSAGRYAIARLRPGLQAELHASAAGFQAASQPITVIADSRLGINFALTAASADSSAADLESIEASSDGSRLTLRPDQVSAVPSLVRKDLFRALQLRPGISGSTSDTSQLYVRGGTPDETRVTVDGLNLYQLSDPFGAFTAYNMDTIEQATFQPALFEAGGGGRLAGSLDFVGRAASARPLSGFADVSGLGLNALVSGSVNDRVGVLFAVRKSAPTSLYNDLLDQFLPTAGSSARTRLPFFSGGSMAASTAASDFHDVNGKLAVKASDKDRLSVSVYDGRSDINASHDLALPASAAGTIGDASTDELPSDAVVRVSQLANWTSHGVAGGWQRQWSPSASTSVSVGRSEYTRTGDQSWVVAGASSGQDYSFMNAAGGSDGLSEAGTVRDTTLRADATVGIGFAHSLSAGTEVSALDVTYAVQTEVAHPVAGGAFASTLTDLFNTADSGTVTAVYAQDAWRPLEKLIVSPGVRLAHYDRTASNYFEPRVNATYQLLPILRLKGGASIDHQFINLITREDRLHGDGAFWMASNGAAVPVPRSVQGVAGASLQVNGVVVSLDAYARQVDALTLFAPRLYPGTALASDQRLFSNGSRTSRGIEGLVQYKASRNAIWLDLTVSKTDDSFATLEASPYPASFDRRNEFKLVDVVRIASTWTVNGSVVAAGGRPYTPATGLEQVWFPSGALVYQATFDAKNSARLPFYNRVDLGTQKDFVFRGIRNSLGATVFNVLDRQNILYYEYENAGGSINASGVSMMGRTFNLFFRLGF